MIKLQTLLSLQARQLSLVALCQTMVLLMYKLLCILETVNAAEYYYSPYCHHDVDNHNSHYQHQKVSSYVPRSPVATFFADANNNNNGVSTDADSVPRSRSSSNGRLTLNVDTLLHEILNGNKRLMKRNNKGNTIIKFLNTNSPNHYDNVNKNDFYDGTYEEKMQHKRDSFESAYPSTAQNQFKDKQGSGNLDSSFFDGTTYNSLLNKLNQLSQLQNSQLVSGENNYLNDSKHASNEFGKLNS